MTAPRERLAHIGRGAIAALLAAAALMAACATGDSTAPSQGPATTTSITITPNGVSPRDIVVSPGSQVMFVNNDSVPHQMYSDPHPEHTDCPEFDSVGQLSPGQSRQTTNLVITRTCGFHDHINPFNGALKGSVTVR